MRIIHTADWHLCDTLGRNDRTPDLQPRVARVAELCVEHRADLLVIAGDVFSEQASVEDMTRALRHVRDVFRPFFAAGGTILAVTGNHDRNNRIDMVKAGMDLAMPAAPPGGVLFAGRMYLANTVSLVKVADRDGDLVQFVLLPYPFPSRYNVPADSFQSKEEETRQVRSAVTDWLQRKPTEAAFDVTLPTVLVAHLHVRGSEMNTAYKMRDADDILFDFGELHPEWRYVALGHIHKPQALSGSETVRYPGSLDRLDFGETHSDHGIVLFDVRGADPVRPVRLPIPPTPFHTITILDPDTELPKLAERYPDHATALVRLILAPPTGNTDRDDVARQLKKLFPRWHSLDWADPQRSEAESSRSKFDPRAGFEATVRDYLTEQLAGDPDAPAVLALADTFLAPGGRP